MKNRGLNSGSAACDKRHGKAPVTKTLHVEILRCLLMDGSVGLGCEEPSVLPPTSN